MKRVFVQSYGCRASQADGAAIEASLEDSGFRPVRDASQADLVVLNTCTVTHSADIDTRRVIRGLQRDHPDAEILVTGCYAQRAPAELAALPGVRWVIGNSRKTQIAELFTPGEFVWQKTTEDYHGEILVDDISQLSAFAATPVRGIRGDRTRPNLKIQDGCPNRCSFCIIPSVRGGRSRSATVESVVAQVNQLATRYREIVLSGINLGRWGRDLSPQLRFFDLLRLLLVETPVERLRISSVEPMDWSAGLLEFIAAQPRIARHVHLPLQSGSDAVLKRMFRKYRSRHYASRLQLAHTLLPNAALGADVMTGFPGETDAEFAETVEFVEQQPFTYLHVFTYSERPGTPAATYANPVPPEVRHERTRLLRELSARKNLAFRRRQLDQTLSAVTLEQPGFALTTNFLKIKLAANRPPNQLIDVTIGSQDETGLREKETLHVL
ncbi:MAG TPA: tRNA (N(6)-L-threonylcarbamoyladenosine(37)-C(2))-methylthiotransferase MtaB [Bryobacteraceae bacterium]|nr:tRNA (N(6)-L-threonylcarbamoyladenosine(37)-C(2))-methylthiotransferase MtaB [Bryobacteraceae bacterium]